MVRLLLTLSVLCAAVAWASPQEDERIAEQQEKAVRRARADLETAAAARDAALVAAGLVAGLGGGVVVGRKRRAP